MYICDNLLLFSRSVKSHSLRPHGLHQARLPCPSLSPRICSNSCSLNWWCHPTVSTSVTPVSSCLQSFPVSGTFPMSQFLACGGQNIGASASVLPMNIQTWYPFGLKGKIIFIFYWHLSLVFFLLWVSWSHPLLFFILRLCFPIL